MISKKKFSQLLALPLAATVLFSAKPSSADALSDWYGHFGACLLSPSSSRYETMWRNYEAELRQKVTLNIPALAEMPVSKEISEYLANLSTIAPLVTTFNEIKTSAWAKQLYAIPNYNEVISSQAFIYALEDPTFMQTTKDPTLQNEYDSDSQFHDAFDQILQQLKDPDVQTAISYFQSQGLSFIDPDGMQSALKLITFYKLPGGLDSIKFVSLFKALPKPAEPSLASDSFGKALWTLETNAVVDFLENNPVTASRTVSAKTASTLNALVSPEGTSPYDDYLVKYHQEKEANTKTDYYLIGKKYTLDEQQISAIDGVARTLWGEVAECANAGMHQFEVVGIAITNRALAITSALNEETKVQQDNDKINMNDVDAALHLSDKSYTQKYEQNTSQGVKVFGIPYSNKLPAEQVVSRPMQFSIWNSFGTSALAISDFGRLPVGIPAGIRITFEIPVTDSPLINALCPQISANESSNPGWGHSWPDTYDVSWKQAVDLATMIVLDPNLYKKTYETSPKPRAPVMSYTDDGIPLEGLNRQPLSAVTYVDPYTEKTSKLAVFGAPVASCNTLHIFSYPLDANFGVAP